MLNFPDQEQNKISRLCLATKIVTDCQSKRSVERGRLMGRRLSALYADSILCCCFCSLVGIVHLLHLFVCFQRLWFSICCTCLFVAPCLLDLYVIICFICCVYCICGFIFSLFLHKFVAFVTMLHLLLFVAVLFCNILVERSPRPMGSLCKTTNTFITFVQCFPSSPDFGNWSRSGPMSKESPEKVLFPPIAT